MVQIDRNDSHSLVFIIVSDTTLITLYEMDDRNKLEIWTTLPEKYDLKKWLKKHVC